jgi:hypothetical protein
MERLAVVCICRYHASGTACEYSERKMTKFDTLLISIDTACAAVHVLDLPGSSEETRPG